MDTGTFKQVKNGNVTQSVEIKSTSMGMGLYVDGKLKEQSSNAGYIKNQYDNYRI